MQMNTNEKIDKLETVGVVLRPESPQLKEYFLDFKKFLASKNIKVLLDKKSAKMISVPSPPMEMMISLCLHIS